MSRRYHLHLTEDQRADLTKMRDHDPLPYIRVKAHGILQVADGHFLQETASHLVLKPRKPETVKLWCERFLHDGRDGLVVQTGRGRKPAFSPVHLDPETASAELQGLAYRSPHLFGRETSRWRLLDFQETVSWLSRISLSGIGKILKRLQVSYKRGRMSLHSPDKDYDKKLAVIRNAKEACYANPGKVVFLYEDEHTFGRYPTVADAYAGRGIAEQTAEQYAGYNCLRRIAGCLDISTGAFISRQRNHFTADQMGKFYQFVEEQYPDAEIIYIALDNWKVHFEPFILEELEKRKSRIRLLRLPTYAPWTNPTEKVWRLFKQEITHMHPFTYEWSTLRKTIDAWFEERRKPSQELLSTVGLQGDSHANASA